MQNLEPDKQYSELEIKDLCDTHKIKDIRQLLSNKYYNTNGYGTIIQKKDKIYRLHPYLVKEFKKYF
jgi:hypothetical protein